MVVEKRERKMVLFSLPLKYIIHKPIINACLSTVSLLTIPSTIPLACCAATVACEIILRMTVGGWEDRNAKNAIVSIWAQNVDVIQSGNGMTLKEDNKRG